MVVDLWVVFFCGGGGVVLLVCCVVFLGGLCECWFCLGFCGVFGVFWVVF